MRVARFFSNRRMATAIPTSTTTVSTSPKVFMIGPFLDHSFGTQFGVRKPSAWDVLAPGAVRDALTLLERVGLDGHVVSVGGDVDPHRRGDRDVDTRPGEPVGAVGPRVLGEGT